MAPDDPLLKRCSQAIRKAYPGRLAGIVLYGSVARGEDGPESDIDILVEFEPGAAIGFLAFAALQRELSGLLGRPVDLVPKNGLKAAIRQEVLSSTEVIYAR